jgi:hypothetical protein
MLFFYKFLDFTSLAIRGAVVASPFLFLLHNLLVAPESESTFGFVLALVLPVIFALILFKDYYTFVKPVWTQADQDEDDYFRAMNMHHYSEY